MWEEVRWIMLFIGVKNYEEFSVFYSELGYWVL